MDDIVLEPTTRARVKDIPAKRKATTDPLGTTVQIEAGLPDAPLSPDGLTSRQVLHRTRERLRAQAAANPADTGSWWTALPSATSTSSRSRTAEFWTTSSWRTILSASSTEC